MSAGRVAGLLRIQQRFGGRFGYVIPGTEAKQLWLKEADTGGGEKGGGGGGGGRGAVIIRLCNRIILATFPLHYTTMKSFFDSMLRPSHLFPQLKRHPLSIYILIKSLVLSILRSS